MKAIVLTQNKFCMVDDEDFEYLNQFKWFAYKGKRAFYAGRAERIGIGKQRFVSMHRILIPIPEGNRIDHIDGDGLNNQKINLRACTNQQNCWNQQTSKTNKTGYKGVHPKKKHGKLTGRFFACIQIEGRLKHLGSFSTPEEGARAYNAAALKHYGSFARLNVVPE